MAIHNFYQEKPRRRVCFHFALGFCIPRRFSHTQARSLSHSRTHSQSTIARRAGEYLLAVRDSALAFHAFICANCSVIRMYRVSLHFGHTHTKHIYRITFLALFLYALLINLLSFNLFDFLIKLKTI